MPDPELEIRGVVLNQEEIGENFIRLTLFCPNGLRRCLLRKVRKLSAISPPDLFDETEIAFQANNSQGLPFIKEHQVLQKRMSLAFDRDVLMPQVSWHAFTSIMGSICWIINS